MKKTKLFLALMACSVLLISCGKEKANSNNEGTATPDVTEHVTVAPTLEPEPTTETVDGKVKSKLTNEWVEEDKGTRRPYAIMLSNIKAASPQNGISQASILYEALVEGGITRCMGIFEDFDAEKIGSVRSARHYYASLADEYDAIFVHYGESKYTEAKLTELGVDNLSGLTSIGSTVFYRDSNIKAPHNAFASYNGIMEGTEKLKYRTEYRENLVSHYDFNEEDVTPDSDLTANTVALGFSKSYSPYFEYDEATKLYKRFQFDEPHVDATTQEQLAFKNLIIQFVTETTMDSTGRQDMAFTEATGEGYYISDGKAMKITWKKSEKDKFMSYYDESGNKLAVNTGKTYIALFPDDKTSNVTIK